MDQQRDGMSSIHTDERATLLRTLGWLGLVILLAFIIWTGLRGIDFGYHWDEGWAQMVPLQKSLETWTLLPGFYLYPSLNYWLNLSALVPSAVKYIVAGERGAYLARHLFQMADTQQVLLVAREIRLVLSSLAIVWVYVFVRSWRKSTGEALVAAGVLGLSWEIAYHARWVAPDDVMMQFGAMTLMFCGLAILHPGQARWWLLGTASAALATGTKYPAGLLLLPVMAAVVIVRSRTYGVRGIWVPLVQVMLVFGGVFVMTTPGAVLQPWHFLRDLRQEQEIYAQIGHVGYTVKPGFDHLAKMAVYLGVVLFSHYPAIAITLAALALVGLVAVIMESKTMAFTLMLFPVIYLGFFASQKVMIVRNVLVVAPFLAVFCGCGLAKLWGWLRGRVVRTALAISVAGMLLMNAYWLVYAANTITDRGTERFAQDMAAFIRQHPKDRFLASPGALSDLAAVGIKPSANLTTAPSGDVEYVLVHRTEAMDRGDWPANSYDLIVRSFGPQEVNFNYYPTWAGDERVLMMTLSKACAAGVGFVGPACPAPPGGP